MCKVRFQSTVNTRLLAFFLVACVVAFARCETRSATECRRIQRHSAKFILSAVPSAVLSLSKGSSKGPIEGLRGLLQAAGTWPRLETRHGRPARADEEWFVFLPLVTRPRESFEGELSPVWVETWGGPGLDRAWDVAVDGGYLYVTGLDVTALNGDMVIRKYDLDGALQWEKRWDGGGADVGFVAVISEGYLYVGGKAGDWGGTEDALLLKYTLDGTLVWARTWGTEDYEEVDGLAVRGGTLFAYVWTGPIWGDLDVGILKYDLDGELLESVLWEMEGRNEANGHLYANSTGIYGAGGVYTGASVLSDSDAFLATFDLDGTYLWHATWGGERQDDALNLTSDGEHLYVAGMTGSYGGGKNDAFALKYTMDGELIWAKTWGGPENDVARGIAVDDEHVWVAAKTQSYGDGGWDVALLKYGRNGTFTSATLSTSLGYKLWGGPGDDEQHSLAIDATHVYIVGETSSYGTGDRDAFLLKVEK